MWRPYLKAQLRDSIGALCGVLVNHNMLYIVKMRLDGIVSGFSDFMSLSKRLRAINGDFCVNIYLVSKLSRAKIVDLDDARRVADNIYEFMFECRIASGIS